MNSSGKRLIAMIGLWFAASASVGGQEFSQAIEQSDLSKILKASGTLYLRSGFDLPGIRTTSGHFIQFEVVVVKVLAGKEALRESGPTVGVAFRIEEEYADRTASIDMDEVEGLLASLRAISSEGLSILTTSIVEGLENDAEIHYTTKEDIRLGAFELDGKLRYGLQIGTRADWAILSHLSDGVTVLEQNLSRAIEIASAVETAEPSGGLSN